jgi:hypothetical protein
MNVVSLRLMLVSAGSTNNRIYFGYSSTVLQVFNFFWAPNPYSTACCIDSLTTGVELLIRK